MKHTVKESNKAARGTWEKRAVGGHRSQSDKFSQDYFSEITKYRYCYETPFIPKVFNFHNLNGKKVLEVGVGHGIDAVSMIDHGATYSGIDITDNHLELAKSNIDMNIGKKITKGTFKELIKGEITEIDFSEKYDVIYSFGVLHHIDHEQRVLEKINNLLQDDGQLRFSVYASGSFFSIYMLITWIFINRMKNTLHEWVSHKAEDSDIDNPVTIKIRSKNQIIKSLKEANFEVISHHRKGFVQGYIPFLGKFLHPDGMVLNFFGSFLGWYHCFTCKVKK